MSSHQMWYKLRNELKWRELQVPSTFMTVGELRGLIIEHLGLPDGETVVLYPEEDLTYESPYPDVKQFPRGSRFRATRTTVEQLAKEEEQRAGQSDAEPKKDELTQKDRQGDKSDAESEESEFGPDPWDRDAADRWKEKERRTSKQQIAAAKQSTKDPAEVVTPAPLKVVANAQIPDSQELPALTYPHQSRELTLHEWEEKLKPRRKTAADHSASLDNAPPGPGDPVGLVPPQPTSTALVPTETWAVPPTTPAKPSLLQQYPEIQYRCRPFLPQAPVELLYEVFGVGRAMNRAEWDKWRADNAERNPAQESTPPRGDVWTDRPGRSYPQRPHAQPQSRSPRENTRRDRSRTASHGRSPAQSPAQSPWRHNPRMDRSPFGLDRWRDSDQGVCARQSSDAREQRPASRDVDGRPRPSSRALRSVSRSSVSPRPRHGRNDDVSASPAGVRPSAAPAPRRTSVSASPPPRAPPRRRNFDTQLQQPPAARRKGNPAPRGGRKASPTPPPLSRAHDTNGNAAKRHEPSAPTQRRHSPRRPARRQPTRSRSRSRNGRRRVDAGSKRRRASPSGSSSSSSSSGSDSGSGSGTSSSSSSSSSSRSRSPRRSSPVKPQRRYKRGKDRENHGGRGSAGRQDRQGGRREGAERVGTRDRKGQGRKVPAKAGRGRADSPEDLKRAKKGVKVSQTKSVRVPASKPSPKPSKDRSALFAKAVEVLRR